MFLLKLMYVRNVYRFLVGDNSVVRNLIEKEVDECVRYVFD